ncbi:uncharacterized protein LOC114760278 [Neltuma alba]|uniref:uncharacterized protein LOC114760278 n=1 Tax=Neltuma alba TaxID=207710 RepID=UPI0010A4C2A1|nr:uncharacterized protein LOC114760278 [Prosopis alba]
MIKQKEEVKISNLPFPNSFLVSRKLSNNQLEKDAMNLFSKLAVNVPLLDFLKRAPKYVRFLKKLCTNKKKCKPNGKVQLGSNVSAISKPQLPIKCANPRSFTILCTVGQLNIANALLDLRATINVMPLSLYTSLGIQTIKSTSMLIQLADMTVRKPKGLLEDIMVKVKDLVIPTDFYVLDMDAPPHIQETLILGMPFLRTANTVVSLKDGYITIEVRDKKIQFDVYEAMKHPFKDYSLLDVNAIDCFIDEAKVEYECSLHKLNEEETLDTGFSFLDVNSLFCLDSFLDDKDDVCSIDSLTVDSSLSTLSSFSFDLSSTNDEVFSHASSQELGNDFVSDFVEMEKLAQSILTKEKEEVNAGD